MRSLDSRLASLDEDARWLWADHAGRRNAIRNLVDRLGSEIDARAAADRIDRSVVLGLRALGLPRGFIRGPYIDWESRNFGQKTPGCALWQSGVHMRTLLDDPRGPDTTVRTWVHESIHARAPYAEGFRQEYVSWRGYEEGLAEGLARLVVREKAGMDPLDLSYGFYVAAYRTLALAADLEIEALWRALWSAAPGRVRTEFSTIVDSLLASSGRGRLDPSVRPRVGVVADRLFASPELLRAPDPDVMMSLWRAVLP